MDEFVKLVKRGTVNIISEQELEKKLSTKKPLRIKFGIDPTASDLHLGHSVLLTKLALFQKWGHKIVFIIGDFTARIGDPSGRDTTRPILSNEEIKENSEKLKSQISKILDINNIELHYNSGWLLEMFKVKDIFEFNSNIAKLLRTYTVSQLMEREDFTQRRQKGEGITLLELIYPLFQGYDSVQIKSDIEIGGIDQLFNLHIARQMQMDFGEQPQVIITLPLLLGTDGIKKMSKSYKNYISLNDTPQDMYGKIMSIPDKVMDVYYELLTDLDMEKVKHHINTQPKESKAELAFRIASGYYGKEKASQVQKEFDNIFSKGKLPQNLEKYISDKKEIYISNLISQAAKLSNKEATRLINQNAIEISYDSIDFQKVSVDTKIIIEKSFILKIGKRKFFQIQCK